MHTHAGNTSRAAQQPAAVTGSAGTKNGAVPNNEYTPGTAHTAGGHLFSQLHLSQPAVQRKTTVNQPGDPMEQEADAVAEKVMAETSVGPVAATSVTTQPGTIQRKCAECEKEDAQVQRKCDHCEEEDKQVQRKASAPAAAAAAPGTVAQTLAAGGTPLDKGTRSFMESRFGYDFGKVKIHNHPLAHQSAKDIHALAYTSGNNIAFADGRFAPQTAAGKKLLAHELTHVVQQSGQRPAVQAVNTTAVNTHTYSNKPAGMPAIYPQGKVQANTNVTDEQEGIVSTTQDAGTPPGPPAPSPVTTPFCHIENAAFESIPSGLVPATVTGGKLGAAFTMTGNFSPVIPCNCSCGEYRQFVKGSFTVNGNPHVHSLGGGRNLDPNTFQEDGDVGAGTVYGHRAVPGTKSKFTRPDQLTGCRFEGADEPGISAPSGTRLAMDLSFIGKLIDTCRGDQELASSTWNVAGAATMP